MTAYIYITFMQLKAYSHQEQDNNNNNNNRSFYILFL